LIDALRNSIALYRDLRTSVFDNSIQLQKDTETRVMKYFEEIEQRL
jgi:hypothetical protein